MNRKQNAFLKLISLVALLAAASLWPKLFGAEPAQPAAAPAENPAASAAAPAEEPASEAESLYTAESNSDTWTVSGEPTFDPEDIRPAGEYTDEELIYWDEGTFDSPQDSLTYHFNKHGAELPAQTVADYLNQAYETRDEVLESTDGWRITKSSGPDEAHKYKNYDDDRFIIMDDETHRIYSFGR